MKRIAGFAAAMVLNISVQAQVPKDVKTLPADRQNIDKLCGCFEVEFKYAETFSPDTAYKFHEREEISGGLELVFPVEASDRKIVMQHLLVITDSMIIKHWREVWTYENPELWNYKGNKTWVKEQLKPEQYKGKWTQTVWEVSDEPRYQGTGEWITTDGKTFWQNTTDAPLPRREYSVRSDYNILKRGNRIIVSEGGYVHEQDNQKIIRKDGADKLLVEEKGINSYKKLNDKECAAAKFYWENNKVFWGKVRSSWENYLSTHSSIELKTKVDGKVLHEYLFELAKQYSAGKIKPADIDMKIRDSLAKFINTDKSMAQNQ
jgi:hypothetical protein